MERIKSINIERIAWCCVDYGIEPINLASELDIPETSIERLMGGLDGITFNQLRKIAEYFGRGILFFMEAGPINEEQVHTTQFRTLANQKPELSTEFKAFIERVEKQRSVYLSLSEDLENEGIIKFTPPNLPQNDPREAATITRKWLRLTDKNTFDTYRAAVEAQNVLVFRSNGYSGKWQIAKQNPILGFTLYDSICPVIVIKKMSWESQQSFTLMHELGHLLLYKTSSIDDDYDLQSHQDHEKDANAFAGHLLVPDSFLWNIRDEERPSDISKLDDWLVQYRKKWGVSSEVILRRLLDVRRLSPNIYSTYRQWRAQSLVEQSASGNRMYRYREPKHIFGDPFVRTVLDALNARHITLAKASSYLDNLKIKDLHNLEHYYAGL